MIDPIKPMTSAEPQVSLAVSALGKQYRLFDSPKERVKSALFGKGKYRTHWALADVSFSLHRGQCLGVIGDNGAGKSTLLKLVTGSLQPSTGQVVRNGRLTAILELGAGFHPEFTGRENLYFGGALIGIDADHMRRLEAEIIAFAELEAAIDRPVKSYSSGMTVRLAFALVTAVEPEILIIDEALAVGDQHFQKKCIERIDAFRQSGCTILFCSHSQYHIRQLCDAALWLDQGRVRAFGPTDMVMAAYESHVRMLDSQRPQDGLLAGSVRTSTPGQPASAQAAIQSFEVFDLGKGDPPVLNGSDLSIRITAICHDAAPPSIGVMLEQVNGPGITSVVTHVDGVQPKSRGDGLWEIGITFDKLPLHSGEYVVSGFLFDSQGMVVYDYWKECQAFTFASAIPTPGLVRIPYSWV
jgi:lipopolysaccharide transport system ATP-binding protein